MRSNIFNIYGPPKRNKLNKFNSRLPIACNNYEFCHGHHFMSKLLHNTHHCASLPSALVKHPLFPESHESCME